jgi:hypothetical protein
MQIAGSQELSVLKQGYLPGPILVFMKCTRSKAQIALGYLNEIIKERDI